MSNNIFGSYIVEPLLTQHITLARLIRAAATLALATRAYTYTAGLLLTLANANVREIVHLLRTAPTLRRYVRPVCRRLRT